MNALRRTHAATALLALTLLLAACSAGALPTQTPTPTNAPTDAPTAPAPTDPASPTPGATPIAVPDVVWERASVPTAQNNSSIIGIVPRPGGGYVAVGYDGVFGSMVWTSPDGLSWTEVPRPEGFDTAGIAEVVPFSGGLLAVGRETGDIESDAAAAWISTDGTDWRRVEGGPDMQGQILDAVETDDGRLIGVGGVGGADAAGIWISTDAGETWQRTDDVIENAFIWSVAAGGPGYVATGWRRNPEPTLAVWTSPDGESWTLAPDPTGGEEFEGKDLINHDGTLVMIGSLVFGGEGRIWTSTDGIAWEVAEAPDLVDVHFFSVAATPFGLVAHATRGQDAMALVSTDGGRSWEAWGEQVTDAIFDAGLSTPESGYIIGGRTQEGTLETGINGMALVWTAVAAR